MNRLRIAFLIVALTLGGVNAWADCPAGLVLKKVGNFTTANGGTNLTGSGADVQAISWQCTGTACGVGFYDSDGASPTDWEEADVVFEVGAAASGGGFREFDPPIFFSTGVSIVLDANSAGAMAYSCQAPR